MRRSDFSATDFISEYTCNILVLRMLTRLHVVISGDGVGVAVATVSLTDRLASVYALLQTNKKSNR